MTDPKWDLTQAAMAVRDATVLLSLNRPTMEKFLEECRGMRSFGPTLAPALFLDKRREKLSAALEPIFQAAILLLEAHAAATAEFVEGMEK